jgi:hypothetical protein
MSLCATMAHAHKWFTSKAGRPDAYRAANMILRNALVGEGPFVCFLPPLQEALSSDGVQDIGTTLPLPKSSPQPKSSFAQLPRPAKQTKPMQQAVATTALAQAHQHQQQHHQKWFTPEHDVALEGHVAYDENAESDGDAYSGGDNASSQSNQNIKSGFDLLASESDSD